MKRIFILVVLALFAGGVFAQAKPAAAPDPALKACRASLDTEYKALTNDHADGLKAGKMSKTEEADYQRTLAALKTKWAEAMKDGASLKECTDQRAAIKKANAELNEMQAVNGKVRICFDEFKKVSAESDKIIADGVKSKVVDAKEEAAYKKRDEALQKKYDLALKSGKVTQAECDGLLKSAKEENAVAVKMAAMTPPVVAAAPDPALTTCRAGLDTEYQALTKYHTDSVKAGYISKAEEVDYQKTLAALKTKWTEATKDGANLKECTDQRAATKKAYAELNEMQAVGGKVRICFDEFKKISAESDKIIVDGIKSKAIDAKEAADYKKRDEALQKEYDAALKSGYVSQKECDGLLASAKAENTAAKSMITEDSTAITACIAELNKESAAMNNDANSNVVFIEATFYSQRKGLTDKWLEVRKVGATLQACSTMRADLKKLHTELKIMQTPK